MSQGRYLMARVVVTLIALEKLVVSSSILSKGFTWFGEIVVVPNALISVNPVDYVGDSLCTTLEVVQIIYFMNVPSFAQPKSTRVTNNGSGRTIKGKFTQSNVNKSFKTTDAPATIAKGDLGVFRFEQHQTNLADCHRGKSIFGNKTDLVIPDKTWSLEDMAKRENFTGSFEWSTADAFGTKLVTIQLPTGALTTSQIEAPFRNFQFSRYDTEFSVDTNSVRFNAGRLIIVYYPLMNTTLIDSFFDKNCSAWYVHPHVEIDAAAMNQPDLKIPFMHIKNMLPLTNRQAVDYTGQIRIYVLAPLTVPTGGLSTVTAAMFTHFFAAQFYTPSMTLHAPPALDQSLLGTLEGPHFQKLRALREQQKKEGAAADALLAMQQLLLEKRNELAQANHDLLDLRSELIKVKYPRDVTYKTQADATPNLDWKSEYFKLKAQYDKIYLENTQRGLKIEELNKRIQDLKEQLSKCKDTCDPVYKVQGDGLGDLVSGVPIVGPTIASILETIDPIDLVHDAFTLFAMDKPAMPSKVDNYVKQAFPYMANGRGQNLSEAFTIDPSEQTTCDPVIFSTTRDEMDMAYLCSIPTPFIRFEWKTTDAINSILASFPIGPFPFGGMWKVGETHVPTMLEATIKGWLLWNGGIDYLLKIFANQMATGKLGIEFHYYVYNDPTTPFQGPGQYVAYIELGPQTHDISVTAKFIYPTDWVQIRHGVEPPDSPEQHFSMGRCVVRVYTQLQVSSGAPTTVECMMLMSGSEDFKVRGAFDTNRSLTSLATNFSNTPPTPSLLPITPKPTEMEEIDFPTLGPIEIGLETEIRYKPQADGPSGDQGSGSEMPQDAPPIPTQEDEIASGTAVAPSSVLMPDRVKRTGGADMDLRSLLKRHAVITKTLTQGIANGIQQNVTLVAFTTVPCQPLPAASNSNLGDLYAGYITAGPLAYWCNNFAFQKGDLEWICMKDDPPNVHDNVPTGEDKEAQTKLQQPQAWRMGAWYSPHTNLPSDEEVTATIADMLNNQVSYPTSSGRFSTSSFRGYNMVTNHITEVVGPRYATQTGFASMVLGDKGADFVRVRTPYITPYKMLLTPRTKNLAGDASWSTGYTSTGFLIFFAYINGSQLPNLKSAVTPYATDSVEIPSFTITQAAGNNFRFGMLSGPMPFYVRGWTKPDNTTDTKTYPLWPDTYGPQT